MHLAINAMFWSQPTVGSGQYLRMLVHALPTVAPDVRTTLLLPAARPVAEPLPPNVQAMPVSTPFDGRNANLAKVWFEQIAVPRAALRLNADLLHVPYFAPPLRPPLPTVVTILDIIPLLLPEYRGRAAVQRPGDRQAGAGSPAQRARRSAGRGRACADTVRCQPLVATRTWR